MIKLQAFLEEKGITLDAFESKTKDEQVALLKEHNAANEKALEELQNDVNNKASKEEIEAFKKELETTHKREIKAIEEANSQRALEITKALREIKGGATQSDVNQVAKFIADNAEEIKNLKSQGHGQIEFTTKAVGSMTTGSATNPDGIPELVGTQVAPASNVNLRGSIVDALVTRFNTNLAAYPYTETVPKDGDYSFVAEGESKPQIDFKIETRYAQPVKVAAHIVLTDESIQDISGMQDIANNYLRAKA